MHYTSDNGIFAVYETAVFMERNSVASITDKKEFKSPTPETDDKANGIAYWGTDNNLPLEMIKDVEATGVLSGAISAKARIALGKGPHPALFMGYAKDGTEEIEFINNNEITDWLELNNAFDYSDDSMQDLFKLGNGFTKLLFNHDRSYLSHFSREDAAMCRFGMPNERTGNVDKLYISSDWERFTSIESDKDKFKVLPLLDRKFPYQDLLSRKSGNVFALSMQYTLSGRSFYAPSPWYAARKWVKIAQGVPEMKEAMFKNQMSIKYLITIHPKYWEILKPGFNDLSPQQQVDVINEHNEKLHAALKGGDNSYKSILNTKVMDDDTRTVVNAIEITTIDDKIKDGKLLPDSNAADIEILLPLMINPSLFGVEFGNGDAYGGGAGSGSNIREGYLIQLMLVEKERRLINKVFDIAKRVNGWQKKYQDRGSLVLRYPSQILTTLNTGAATKNTN